MKDILQDLINHTSNLGFIDLIKVVGTDTETQVSALSDDKNVIFNGVLKTPQPELIGTFGMPNLSKLKTILSFDDYDEDAKITMTRTNREGVDTPDSIHFETKAGDFVNDYRLMAKGIVEEKVKVVKYHGTSWNVEFTPSVNSILRLKKQSQANSDEKHFMTKVENGHLKVFFGDVSTHSGNFVFEANVNGTLGKALSWPVQEVVSILSLAGDKTMRILDKGAMEISIDSGLAVYSYLFPAQQK